MIQEDDLRRALRRREPSEGFTARTLERIRAEGERADERSTARPPSRARAWIAAGLAVAASVVVAVGITREESARREAAARVAAQNLEVALRITSETLQRVQMTVNHVGGER